MEAAAAVNARTERGDMPTHGVAERGLVPVAQMVAADAPVPAAQPVTRQQRRAAERAAQKGRQMA